MRRFQISTVLLLGTMAAFLTGCSRNPVSPDVTMPMNGGAESSEGIQTDDGPSDVNGGVGAVATGTFTAADEGRLTVGRFTLDLHKNTLKMPATITLRVASEDAMEVEIEVSPAEANDFQVPAQLSASLVDKPETNWDAVTMFYWDNLWEQGETVAAHPNQVNVVAHMQHLSACKVADREPVVEDSKWKNK